MAESQKDKVRKLTQEELDSVGGGFKQSMEGFSYGCIIKCPSCGNGDWDQFYCDGDALAAVQKDLYQCAICGQRFAAATGYGITDVF